MSNEPDFDSLETRQLAADVFVMGFPLVLMDTVRRAHPIEFNRILLLADNSMALAPGLADEGVRTVRTSAWIDVSERPVVMHLPHMHGRYFSLTLMDASGEPFASLGSRTGDDTGCDLAIAGQRWRGELTGKLKARRSPTDIVWVVSRITANSASDRAETEALAARQCIVALREPGESGPSTDLGPMRPLEPPPSASVQQVIDMTEQTFSHRLNLLVERAAHGSLDARGKAIKARLAAINDLGRPLEADSELGRILARGFADAAAAIRAGAELAAQPGARGWRTFNAAGDANDPLARAVHAYRDLGGSAPEDVFSLVCDEDEAGREFSGSERYRIHFARGATPPVEAFWSLFVAPRGAKGGPGGPQRGISDRNDLTANPDGSIDLIIQHEIPGGVQLMNWLPAPAGPFTLNMRLHWPRSAAISGAWRMPAVERLGSGFARRSEQRQPAPNTAQAEPPPDELRRTPPGWGGPASHTQFLRR